MIRLPCSKQTAVIMINQEEDVVPDRVVSFADGKASSFFPREKRYRQTQEDFPNQWTEFSK
jgi:hypothetical protein